MEELGTIDPELQMLINNREGGYNYQERRHEAWTESYEYYRDTVTINRLTQRQSVNIPLMKQTIRTLLKDVDDMPVIEFENLDNDKQAEVFKNEYWKYTVEINNMELQDIVDKRQVFLFGRTFDQWQVIDGKVAMNIVDPHDILVDRYMNPYDLHSSRFLIHQHIFVPLSALENNPDYDQEKVALLKKWFETDMGLKKAEENNNSLQEKNQKMSDLGVQDVDDPVLGETIVELTMHFVFRQEEDDEEEQIYQYVEAEQQQILMKKPLEEVMGITKDHYFKTHYNYCTWADDVDRQDFWTDGVADIVRTPNKILNSWFSQEVERRTLSNFGMHYYNSNLEGFQPSTFEPKAWGWYPIPVPNNGKLSDVIQKVDIPANDGNLESMNFLIGISEKASGATATQQGAQTERQTTLGEVQLALGEAKERSKGMSKFYTPAWKARGEMFVKIVEAAGDKLDAVKVYKKGRNTDNIYEREIAPKDWKSEAGYRCKVWSQDERDAQALEGLQKMQAVKAIMPDNPKVDEVQKRKTLEWADFSPEETEAAMEFERQKLEALRMGGGMMGLNPQLQQAAPMTPPVNQGGVV